MPDIRNRKKGGEAAWLAFIYIWRKPNKKETDTYINHIVKQHLEEKLYISIIKMTCQRLRFRLFYITTDQWSDMNSDALIVSSYCKNSDNTEDAFTKQCQWCSVQCKDAWFEWEKKINAKKWNEASNVPGYFKCLPCTETDKSVLIESYLADESESAKCIALVWGCIPPTGVALIEMHRNPWEGAEK